MCKFFENNSRRFQIVFIDLNLEQISARATASVDNMPIETSDVAVRCTLLAGELRERKVTEYKIKKVCS